MGYDLTALKNLPKHFDCYFFLVGDYRNNTTINNFFRDDFHFIASRIGVDAAIIRQTDNSKLEKELTTAIRKHQFCGTTISTFLQDLAIQSPGLLASRTHPKKWKDDERLWYFPFEVLGSNYNDTNILLKDLVDFAHGGSNLMDKITQKPLEYTVGINLGLISISKNLRLKQTVFE